LSEPPGHAGLLGNVENRLDLREIRRPFLGPGYALLLASYNPFGVLVSRTDQIARQHTARGPDSQIATRRLQRLYLPGIARSRCIGDIALDHIDHALESMHAAGG
jgi:hypothetical protein